MFNTRNTYPLLTLLVCSTLSLMLAGCGDENGSSSADDTEMNTGGETTAGEVMTSGVETTDVMDDQQSAGTVSISGGAMSGGLMTAGAETMIDGGTLVEPPSMMCDISGLTPAVEQASGDGNNVTYRAISSTNEPYSFIQIQSLSEWSGPTTPGTYSLDGINYADCGLCLLAYTNCSGESCEKTLYAEEGEVEITEIGLNNGSRLTARLRNVVFREVNIDSSTFQSTQVPNGQTWCVNDFEINQELANPAASGCDQAGVNCLGESIPDYDLLSCATGEMVSAHSLMDQEERGLWMLLTAGWCSACRQVIPQIRDQEDTLTGLGVNVIYVMGEDSNYAEPDLDDCQRYANSYGPDAVERFYIDFGQGRSFANTFDNLWPYVGPNGEFGLPWSGIVRSGMYDYEYVYADGAGVGDINDGINSLVNSQ